ncbi:TrbI/VirB10 family protein [Tunturiibacter gelidiferens]|uniref:TrbI/VirB10 family protein n=1 Tax=Tunturiibacter gelidiferens TaxID=3069689 RepID=A0AAU7YZP3_9BACT
MPEETQTPEAAQVQASPNSPSTPALRDKRVVPEGVAPKQAQGYVVAGLAVLILLAVMFSKNHAKTPPTVLPPNTTPFSSDANARKIAELEQNLTAEQRQSEQQLQQQRAAAATASAATAGDATAPQASPATVSATQVPPTEPRDPIADAERAMAFKARFASNLVSTDGDASQASPSTDGTPHQATSVNASAPRPAEQPFPASASQSAGTLKRAPEVNLNSAHGQPFAIFEGTIIDAVLVDRLDGEFAGNFKVMVTNPVYSEDRQYVLIPEGTFILGDTQKVSSFGQKRLALTFHRMLMPDKYSVDLDQFKGLDQAGETGIKGKVNNHYLQIFGTSIALGVIAGAAEATTNSGYNQSGSDTYRQGIASSLSQSSTNVLDRFINVLPTHTIFEGHRVKVYITQDMLLPAYENHDMPGVF